MDEAKRRSWEKQIQRFRKATPDQKLRAAADQRRISGELLNAGIRARHPDLAESEVEDRAGELIFGTDMWRDICERRRRHHHRYPAS